MKKKVSVCIACRNEVGNVQPLAEELIKQLEQLPQFSFEIIFADNCSLDGTQDKLREICAKDTRIKAILNAKNYPYNSGWNAMLHAQGDCVIIIPADFQVPVELVPKMIIEWEKGAMVVALIKKLARKNKLRFIRRLYYAMSSNLSGRETLSGYSGGLFDKSFMEMCKVRNDPLITFSLDNMILNFAYPLIRLEYDEKPRRSGKSNHSFISLIDIAIMRYVSTARVGAHFAIIAGLGMGAVSFLLSIYYLVRKLLDWHHFPVGIAPLVIGMFFLGSVQLVFLGLIGEYVMLINERQKNMPFVTEKERINFEDQTVE